MLTAKRRRKPSMLRPGSSAKPRGRILRRLTLLQAISAAIAAITATTALTLVMMTRDRAAVQSHCPRPSWADPRMDRIPYQNGTAPADDSKYTLLLNSFRRHDLLKASIAHYAKCPGLDAIRVVWCEDQVGPPKAGQDPSFYSPSVEVQYDNKPSASLNQRFTPPPGLRTMAVLSLDDDVIVPCRDVGTAFTAWQRTADQMVGWFPRGSMLDADCAPIYLLRDSAVLLRGHYSMVLTKGAFLHRDWLTTYTELMPAPVLRYVDEHRNCEDIAMAFLVANATGSPPVYVRSSGLRDLGQGVRKVKGISSVGGHVGERSRCLQMFVKHFGGIPLHTRSIAEHPWGWLLRLSTIWDRAV